MSRASLGPTHSHGQSSRPPVLLPSGLLARASARPSLPQDDDCEPDTIPGDLVYGGATIPVAARRDRGVLTMLTGLEAGKVVAIQEELTIGRTGNVGLRIDDTGVSRRHARILRTENDRFVLEDLGSRNGTFVDSARVARRELTGGDRIQLGPNAVLQFSRMDAAEESLARQMYDASTTDPLTRVANRRHFGERLEAEVAYSARHRTPLHLVLFDIDHFKRVNDTHGHAAGDIVLRIVAAQVGRTIRAEDLLARYGGEEFAILVRGIPASHVATMAERVRASVQRLEIPLSSESLRVTISVGVASIPQPGEARSLLEVADERLYRAKHAGRNRVCVR